MMTRLSITMTGAAVLVATTMSGGAVGKEADSLGRSTPQNTQIDEQKSLALPGFSDALVEAVTIFEAGPGHWRH